MKSDMYHVYCHTKGFPHTYRREVKYQLKDRTGLVCAELHDPQQADRICELLNNLYTENERLRAQVPSDA